MASKTDAAMHEFPIVANGIATGALCGVADVLAQGIERKTGLGGAATSGSSQFDTGRIARSKSARASNPATDL